MATKDKAASEPREPVVPFDEPPKDLPGTERGVKAELDGEAEHVGLANIDRINAANAIKNDGVQANLPPWTITTLDEEPLILKIRHFGIGSVRANQATETEQVRKDLSWPRNRPIPQWGMLEINARTMCYAIVDCTSGGAVDIDGAVKASRARNNGIWYIFPSQLLPGVEVKLRHFGHPYISIVEADATDYLKGRMGIRRNKPLPDYARAEVERRMVLHSIIEAKGKVVLGKQVVDLGEMNTVELRKWFQENLLLKADLRGKVPTKRSEREAYFQVMYESQNPDVLAAFIQAHVEIRTAENDEILARGDDFRVGADWDYEPGSAIYKPAVDPIDLTKKPLGDLRTLFREHFFPKTDLKKRPPKDAQGREDHFVGMYENYNNHLLNELIELEGEIRDTDHDALLEKGADFVVGASEGIAFNE